MIGATDVFVSYKAQDRARLVQLVEALEAEGFAVWWDAKIAGGTNWQEDIEAHLESARCVIVAWSKRSVGQGGHFVRDEARRAQQRGSYLPIRLDDAEPPLGFGEIQAISLKGWHGDRSDARSANCRQIPSYPVTMRWWGQRHKDRRRRTSAAPQRLE